MYNIELNMEYFDNQPEGQDEAYTNFVAEYILQPLGFGGYASEDRQQRKVTIDGAQEEIDVFRNDKLAVYDLYHHVWKHRYVVSFQRKSLMGIQSITEVIDKLKMHPAFMEVNEEQYFVF